MPFNQATLREDVAPQGDASGLIPEEAANDIIQRATESSAVMRLARRLPNMSRRQRRMPVLSALPTAYFVNAGENQSDTRFKHTTKVQWSDVFINAEEQAVIVPVPENVLDDSAFDIWGQTRPLIAEAIGASWDRAVLYGEGKPAIWPTDLVSQIVAAGNVVSDGGDLYDDLLDVGGVIAKVEEGGSMVTGHVAKLGLRAKLRGLRTDDGEVIFKRFEGVQGSTFYALDGEQIEFPKNGSFLPDDPATLISGDWDQLVYAIRQDLSFKVLDQAVITDPTNGNQIVYNLPQQDMVALRVTFRSGWALPNPASRVQPDENARFPFAAYAPSGVSS